MDFHDFLLVILISPIIILIYIDQMASGLFYNSPDGLCSKRHILRLVLQPQDMPLTAETVRTIVEESRSHLIYVNEYHDGTNEDDE